MLEEKVVKSMLISSQLLNTHSKETKTDEVYAVKTLKCNHRPMKKQLIPILDCRLTNMSFTCFKLKYLKYVL